MSGAELAEIRDFLAARSPFAELPAPVLDALPRRLRVRYVRAGTRLLSVGEPNDVMYVLRSGAVDIRSSDGQLVERSDPGTCFAMSTLLERAPSRYDFTAVEDSLLLVMPGEVFTALAEEHPGFREFYSQANAARLRRALTDLQLPARGAAVLKTTVADLVRRPPVTTGPDASVREAAQRMAAERVSCLPVVREGRLLGIVTDRDLRTRVLAAGLDSGEPVARVMTPDPATVRRDALAFEVLLLMVDRAIHHLPVVDGAGRVVGLVTSTDLIRLEHDDPVHLVGDVAAAGSVEQLAVVSRRLPGVLEQLVAEDATAEDMGRVVTALGDAIERRLLALAEADLGAPPARYCWVVLGSQARHEQGLASDQDNAILLAEEPDAETAGWVAALAERVTAGLEACGYPRCPGDVMATNPLWRVGLPGWREHFGRWLAEPGPHAVLRAAIFYDMRGLHGDTALVDRLREPVLAQTARESAFLAHLARRATAQRPPVGFFRGLVLEKEGAHRDTLDLKKGGVGAVVQLARVHALAAGSPALSTRARLEAGVQAGTLSAGLGAEVQDALEFLAYLRLRHQGRAVRAGREPDNHVRPADLTDFERRHLRDAFRVVQAAQHGLVARLAPEPLG